MAVALGVFLNRLGRNIDCSQARCLWEYYPVLARDVSQFEGGERALTQKASRVLSDRTSPEYLRRNVLDAWANQYATIEEIACGVTADPDTCINRAIRKKAEETVKAVEDGARSTLECWKLSFIIDTSFRESFTKALLSVAGEQCWDGTSLPFWKEIDSDIEEVRSILLSPGNHSERVEQLIELDVRIVASFVATALNGIGGERQAVPVRPGTGLALDRDAVPNTVREPVIVLDPLIALKERSDGSRPLTRDYGADQLRIPNNITLIRFGKGDNNPWLSSTDSVRGIVSRDEAVSSCHCEIKRLGGEWILKDVGSGGEGSTNGTLIIRKTSSGSVTHAWCQGDMVMVQRGEKSIMAKRDGSVPIVNGDVICIAPTSKGHKLTIGAHGICYQVVMP